MDVSSGAKLGSLEYCKVRLNRDGNEDEDAVSAPEAFPKLV
jgi:hypothetical protein